uniref:BIR-domain-containing protein n=1 Tax=Bionectria ochroleuca TaxID=29856 RepID=A0A8H7TTE4_BIOOC
MADITVDDQYLTFDGRLASFQKTKKRGSTAGGRGAKAQNWPHKTISPESLARAGFFFLPFSDNPDNVVCFLCEKSMDGWEEGDDPLREHLKHSPGCGWAIVAAIEAEMEGYWREDPNHPDMAMARKATFAGRWPHENKRGWKCKTKQLVESGWKYTPTPDSDDMTTCTYCQLAMDGWEADDKPKDEHYKRSPNCAFFALVEEHKQTKKTTRTKAGRGSKASRLSTQSAVSIASESASVAETIAAPDDSVVTTTSVMTQGGTKKSRAKKAPAAKGKKAKSKKEELVVQEPVVQDELEDQQPPIEESPVAQPSKTKRGKKRPSTAIEEPSVVESEAPATKKRATRKRGNTVVESSAIQFSDDESPADVPVETKAAPARKKGRVVSAQKSQKAPVVAPVSSPEIFRAPPGGFPDDDEIERQLEAELEAPLRKMRRSQQILILNVLGQELRHPSRRSREVFIRRSKYKNQTRLQCWIPIQLNRMRMKSKTNWRLCVQRWRLPNQRKHHNPRRNQSLYRTRSQKQSQSYLNYRSLRRDERQARARRQNRPSPRKLSLPLSLSLSLSQNSNHRTSPNPSWQLLMFQTLL